MGKQRQDERTFHVSARIHVPLILLALVAFSYEALASCRTVACHRMRSERGLEALAEAEARLSSWHATPHTWKSFYDTLGQEAFHRQYLAAYRTRFDWEIPEDLRLDSPEEQAERLQSWAARWRERLPDDPDAWCASAVAEADAGAALRLIETGRERLPDAPRLATCHAETLARVGRFAEALDTMRVFRDRHLEDADAHRAYIRYLRSAQSRPNGSASGTVAWPRRRLGDDAADRLVQQQAHAPSDEDVAEAYEVFAAFVDTLDAQLAHVRFLLEHGLNAAAESLLQRLATRHWEPSEHHSLCQGLRRIGVDATHTLACWKGLAAVAADDEPFTELLRAMARSEVIMVHAKSGDDTAIDAFLTSLQPRERLLAAVNVRLYDPGSCGRFRSILGASMSSGEEAIDERTWRQIERRLRGCKVPEQDSLHTRVLEALGRSPAAQRAQLKEAIASKPGRAPGRYRLPGRSRSPVRDASKDTAAALEELARLNADAPAGERADHLRRWAALMPANAKPIEQLVDLAVEQGDSEAAVAQMDEAMRRGADGIDLVLRIGAIALAAERHDDVARAARLVATADSTSPRQQAEAAYLLARVDRAAGRLEDASTGFEHYFTRRLSYEGCCRLRDCDRGFLLHLIESHDRSRLDRYLARRSEALRHFREQVPAYRARLAHERLMTCKSDDIPTDVRSWLDEGCVLASTVAYLDRAAAADPANHRIRRRLADAGERPLCAARGTGATIDTRFDDEALLALVADMRRLR